MSETRTAIRPYDIPLLALAVLFAAIGVVLEASIRLPVKLPGHRAWPGALVLLLTVEAAPPKLLVPIAAGLGVVAAVVSGTPLLVLAWIIPALLLLVVRRGTTKSRIMAALGCGLLFGALRYLALPDVIHHTPRVVRLAGHLAFGVLGGATAVALITVRKNRS